MRRLVPYPGMASWESPPRPGKLSSRRRLCRTGNAPRMSRYAPTKCRYSDTWQCHHDIHAIADELCLMQEY